MNSHELLRPPGAGTGIWACGECHKPHVVAWRANKAVADLNKKAAEECCALRLCHYGGRPTERDWSISRKRAAGARDAAHGTPYQA